MTTDDQRRPIPMPPPKQIQPALTPVQEGRLRVLTSVLSHDRSRPTDELLDLLHAVITGDLEGGDDS